MTEPGLTKGPAINARDPVASDITARFSALREVLHNEIDAVRDLLESRIVAMDSERQVLLTGLNSRSNLLQEDIDRRFGGIQLQLDQRIEHAREVARVLEAELDRRMETVRREAAGIQLQIDQRFETESMAREVALATATAAIQAALRSAETAVNKAEVSTEKRFEGVNEFRKQLSDQTATFPTREEVRAQIEVVRVSAERNTQVLNETAAQVVPRNETEAWRNQLVERINAIELRFTSRLDTAAGHQTGSGEGRTERRLDSTLTVQTLALILVGLSIVISVAALILTRK